MQTEEIRATLLPIFESVLDRDNLSLIDAVSAKDIDEWDSLSNVRLMVAIERKFRIKFSAADVDGLKNVGDLIKSIETKTA